MKPVSYSLIFQLLQGMTPLPEDCGEICESACCGSCREDDKDNGMLLFPGEPVPDGVKMLETAAGRLAVCDGTCERKNRPLSCRIFPLFPLLETDDRIRVVYDPRAFGVCPLLKYAGNIRLRPDFVRAVRKVGRLLADDPDCRKFLADQSDEIRAYYRLSPLRKQRAPICRRKIEDQKG